MSIDTNAEVRVPKFLQAHPVSYPNLLDNPARPVNQLFGVTAIPSMFLIDQKGRVLRYFRGSTDERTLADAVNSALAAKE